MSSENMILLGLVASAITFGLKLLANYAGYKPGRVVVNIFLYVLSVVFAVVWSGAVLPVPPSWGGDILVFVQGLWDYLNQWVALGTPILGTAALIYNLLYEQVVLPIRARFMKK